LEAGVVVAWDFKYDSGSFSFEKLPESYLKSHATTK